MDVVAKNVDVPAETEPPTVEKEVAKPSQVPAQRAKATTKSVDQKALLCHGLCLPEYNELHEESIVKIAARLLTSLNMPAGDAKRRFQGEWDAYPNTKNQLLKVIVYFKCDQAVKVDNVTVFDILSDTNTSFKLN